MNKKTLVRSAVVFLILCSGAITNAFADVSRLGGANRYATADSIVNLGWPIGTDTAIVASGLNENRVDTLTVAPLAKKFNAPVVLVDPTTSIDSMVAKLTALKVKTVYIANGVGVISDDVKTALEAAGVTVTRLGGLDRYETALNIAKAIGTSDAIVVANGDNEHLVDTLSIASIAATSITIDVK